MTLFGTLMDYHGALQRYSLQIKGRYIEVRSRMRIPSQRWLDHVLWYFVT